MDIITYKVCTEVTLSQIYQAFSLGFSDYIISLKMDQEAFIALFFGPEGNALNISFIAMDENCPVGVILGGIRLFDGLKTMRCGTLCIVPDYRGKGISHKLFEMHKTAAIHNQCEQLFLEVIKDNQRAIKFYEKMDYRPVYTLKYYFSMVNSLPSATCGLSYAIKEINFDVLDTFRKSLIDCHINWQSDTPFYANSTNEVILGAYDGDKRIAMIDMNPQGKINFLWVDHAYRKRGLGGKLLREEAMKRNVEKVTVCIPSNASLEGFFRKCGFEKQSLEQYEMYLPL